MEIKPFEIKDWQKGMAQSCHLGFEEIRGMDIFTVPGEATVNYKLSNISISSDSGINTRPIQILNNITLKTGGTVDYVLLSDGDVWSGSPLTELKADGFLYLCAYKGYLIATDSSNLSTYDGTSWLDGVMLGAVAADFMLSSLDDKLYIASASGNKIYTIEEKAGQTFDPNNSATYTLTSPALTLPADMQIVCMVDFGTYIAIAANSKYDATKAYIYLWDGEATAPSNRVIINGGNVNAMIAKNNLLYCQIGNKADWYVSNGSSAELFAKMPESFLTYTGAFTVYRNAVDFNEKGNIIFGIYQSTASSTGMTPNGIFELNTKTGEISFDNIATCGVGSASDPVSIESLRFDTFRTYSVGWASNATTYGVDSLSTSRRITSYGAFIVSPFYQLGSTVGDKTVSLKGFEIHLTKNLPSSCGIKMYYRTTQGGSWTQWGDTMTTATNIFWQSSILDRITNIQFKIELTTATGADSTPTLLKAIIY